MGIRHLEMCSERNQSKIRNPNSAIELPHHPPLALELDRVRTGADFVAGDVVGELQGLAEGLEVLVVDALEFGGGVLGVDGDPLVAGLLEDDVLAGEAAGED